MLYQILFIFIAFFVIALLMVGIVSMRLMLIIIFLFMPTFTAVIFDKSRDKCLSLCVGLMNVSAMILYSPLIVKSLDFEVITQLFSYQMTYSVCFSCFTGFILYLTMPTIIKFCYELLIETRKNRLQNQINRLMKNWEV